MKRLLLSIALVPITCGIVNADFIGSGSGFAIPDNDPGGMTSIINVPVNEVITDVDITLEGFSHTWIGDLTVQLTGPGGNIDVMWRTGDAQGDCCGDSSDVNGNYTFSDGGGDWWAAAAAAGSGDTIPPGTYNPTGSMGVVTSFSASFAGTNTLGNWTLFINDQTSGDTGFINGWTLSITSFPVPEPSSLGLFGLASVALAFYRRRKTA